MIREVQGDILLSHAQVIAHGIATHDPFDSGLALALRGRLGKSDHVQSGLGTRRTPRSRIRRSRARAD